MTFLEFLDRNIGLVYFLAPSLLLCGALALTLVKC